LSEFHVLQPLAAVETSIEQDKGSYRHAIKESDRSNLLRFDTAIISPLELKQVILECGGH